MDQLFLPVLSHFQNGNFWTASAGRMRYQVTPEGETLTAQVWEGPWCRALSRVVEERTFPLNEGGLAALADWAGTWADIINARPAPTLAETLAARDAILAEQGEKGAG